MIKIRLLEIGQNLISRVFVVEMLISWCSDDLSPELSTVSVDKCEYWTRRTLAQVSGAEIEEVQDCTMKIDGNQNTRFE